MTPLAPRDAFPVRYEGRVEAAAHPEAEPARDAGTHQSAEDPGASTTIRFALVELTAADAARLLPEWTRDAGGYRPECPLMGGHVERAHAEAAIAALAERELVQARPQLVSRIGTTSTISFLTQLSFVQRLDLWPTGDRLVTRDLQLGHCEHGTELSLSTRSEGERIRARLEWRVRELTQPTAVDTHPFGSLSVPVVTSQRVSADFALAATDDLVFGPLPTTTPGEVLLLFLQHGEGTTLAAPGR